MDRFNFRVNRPEGSPGAGPMFDSAWGNRYDIGFMTEDNHGWAASFLDSNGTNAFEGPTVYRLNTVNFTVIGAEGQPPGTTVGTGVLVGPIGTLEPRFLDNTPGTDRSIVHVHDSLNDVSFRNFELSKTWRLEPYHYGGVLEPMIGFRHMNVLDVGLNSSFALLDTLTGAGAPPATRATADAEQLISNRAESLNQMYGGQVGFRYFKFRDRFRFSAELRAFGMQNYQTRERFTRTETTFYGAAGVAIGSEAVAQDVIESNRSTTTNDAFVFGYDVRGEIAYNVTRHLELRLGVQILDLWKGVSRNNSTQALSSLPSGSSQRLFAGGITFGAAINR